MNIQTIKNVNDCVPLYLPHSLYLKPFAKFHVSVSLPQTIAGKAISHWDVMEKLRKMIQPDQFSVLKVSKSTLEFIRFDAEIEEFNKLKTVLSRLDGRPLRMSGFSDPVKIRASITRDDFPTRHDWDSFFRDAKEMDEMKAGERPDTIHISNLPIRWFCPRHQENEENVKPSESIFKRIFEKFGEVRTVDIPICDPYRKDMKSHMSGMKTFSFDQELYFEGYVQFNEYLGFVKTMDEFRGMKLVRKEGDKNLAVSISVNFDRTKHLSDASIKRRKIIRDRFIAKDRAKEEEEKKKLLAEEERKERDRRREDEQRMAELERQREREEKRKEKHLKKIREKEQQEISSKIRSEEKKLLVAQRKLESIRVLEALFDRVKLNSAKKVQIKQEDDKLFKSHKTKKQFPADLRNKLMTKIKLTQEQEFERQRNRLKKVQAGGILGSALKGDNSRSPSINSISSDDSVLSDSVQKKKKKTGSCSSSDSEKETKMNPLTAAPPGAFPMYNPVTGQWMGMGMYQYPPPFFPIAPMVRPEFFSNPMSFRGYRGGPRGYFPRIRGRGQYRGRGNYQSYENDQYHKYYKNDEYENYEDDHNRRRSKHSRTRSRSRSRSRSSSSRNSRSSHSRSRSRRSRSRSYSRSRSRRNKSKSRSRSRTHSKSKQKLVSTLRKSKSSTRWSSRSRSHSYRSKRSWSRNTSRSRSHSRRRSRRNSNSKKPVVLQTEKLVRSAKEIQRSVQQKLHERAKAEENLKSNTMATEQIDSNEASTSSYKRRSKSVDSSKFISPKRKEKSATPEKEWDKPIFD